MKTDEFYKNLNLCNPWTIKVVSKVVNKSQTKGIKVTKKINHANYWGKKKS